MDTTIFLTKFWGWLFLIMFFLFLIYPKRLKQLLIYFQDEKFVFLLSFFTIILGLTMVLVHNVWSKDWRVIITLFGWMTLIKGMSQFAFPAFNIELIDKIQLKGFQIMLYLLFPFAIFLLNQAYVWVQF